MKKKSFIIFLALILLIPICVKAACPGCKQKNTATCHYVNTKKHTYTCGKCGRSWSENHSKTYKKADKNYHYKKYCRICNHKISKVKEKHKFKNKRCTKCGYVKK